MLVRVQLPILLLVVGLVGMITACDGETGPDGIEPIDSNPNDLGDTAATDGDADGDIDTPFEQDCPDYYDVVSLGTVGGENAMALGLNNKGWVVGYSEYEMTSTRGDPFIWKPDSDNAETGTLIRFENTDIEGMYPIDLLDINDHGEMVGYGALADPSGFGGSSARAFYYSEVDGMILIDSNEVSAINNNGVVVGNVGHEDEGDFFTNGYYWHKDDEVMHFIPRLPGAYHTSGSKLNDINDRGLMAGLAFDYHSYAHAIKYTPETFYTKLPDMNDETFIIRASANAVNNNGQMAGYVMFPSPAWETAIAHPIVWEANGTMHDLGILASPDQMYAGHATDINDDGIVVGSDQALGNLPPRPWVWCGGIKRDLDDLIEDDEWSINWPAGINNEGQIAVTGANSESSVRPALLIPRFHDSPTVE